MEIQRDRTEFDFSRFFLRLPRDLPDCHVTGHYWFYIRIASFDPNVTPISVSSNSHQATSTTFEARVVVLATTVWSPRRIHEPRASSSLQTESP
ncbi:hypothetical protein K523DRAFT_422229 [Schizophyllum commune Tattone D]|nr:hypothetical protein K525DRAFT_274936 [Schizophyllum commune Loenen D]KAI5822051.1 hypothetical protein K523DRAFT_422229 [Schizophyllum commune Tattone D]